MLLTFVTTLAQNLSQWKKGSHDSYLWLRVSRGAAPDLFVHVVYAVPIVSKHKSKSLFQNLTVNITKVQTLGGIILLGGDFHAHSAALLDIIDTSDLCELLQAPEFAEIEQLNVMTKR